MTLRSFVLFLYVALALLASSVRAQECHTCSGTGLKECRYFKKKHKVFLDEGVLCSATIECKGDCKGKCAGTGFYDCHTCEKAEQKPEYKKWQRLVEKHRKWLAHKKEYIDDQMKMECLVGETKHFYMVWMVPKIKIGRRVVKKEELLRIYINRMESLRADYLGIFGLASSSLAPMTKVMVWKEKIDNERATRLYTGIGANGNGVKLYGPKPVYSTWREMKNMRSDDDLHRHLVHNVAQLLLSSQKPAQWVGNIKGGWMDEGIAHFFEDRYWSKCTNYCYVETNTMKGFKGGHYKPALVQLIRRKKIISPTGIMVKNTEMLTPQEHAQVFSYVDFLISKDPKKFVQLATLLKKKTPSHKAIQRIYGMSLFQFDEAWQEWVVASYPPR